MKWLGTLAVVLSVLLAAGIASAGDVLRIENGGTRQKGVIVDGTAQGAFVNDLGFQEVHTGSLLGALFPVIPLPGFTHSVHDAIVAFAGGRPPALRTVTWTNLDDRITVELEDEYRIAVHVWILASPFDELQSSVATAGAITGSIWAFERMGLAFDRFDIIDATEIPGANQFLDFNCTLVGAIKSQGLFIEGGINIYWANTVNFGSGASTTNGVYCGGDVIGMGRNTGGYLLAHELGHAFSLGHTNTKPGFDSSNIMHSLPPDRRYFTEGQTFRVVFDPDSDINSLYDVRDGQSIVNCTSDTDTADCPVLRKRIWGDGPSWPPN